jgi:hypothetical protein
MVRKSKIYKMPHLWNVRKSIKKNPQTCRFGVFRTAHLWIYRDGKNRKKERHREGHNQPAPVVIIINNTNMTPHHIH